MVDLATNADDKIPAMTRGTHSLGTRLRFALHTHYPLFLALALALSVRILPASYNFVVGTDEALYLTLGGHLAAGDGFTADGIHPHSEFDPGYPLFAALIYRLANILPFDPALSADSVMALELPARLNILLLGSLLVVPIYFLALAMEPVPSDRCRSPKPRVSPFAARAAFLTAAVPALVLGVPNFEAASEQLYTLAIWSGWLFLWLALNRGKWFWFLLSGFAFGWAHLTRWEGLVSAGMAVVVAAVWLIARGNHDRSSRKPSLRADMLSLALLIGGILILALPYAAYQTARTGSVFSTKSIVHQLHGEALASPDPYAWEKSYANYELVRDNPGLYPPLPIYLWEHRTQTVVNYARNTVTQVRLAVTSPTFLFILWLPLALLGIRKFPRASNLFLAATLVPALVFPLSVVDGRYLLPLVPAGMLWAARGLVLVDEWLVCRLATPVSRLPVFLSTKLATILLVSLFVVADVAAMFFIPRPTEFRAAGLALRGVLPAQAPVMMRKRQIAFYANVAYESIPFSDLPGVIADARLKDLDYLELDARTTPGTRPQLAYLLDDLTQPNLQILYAYKSDEPVIVYRILK